MLAMLVNGLVDIVPVPLQKGVERRVLRSRRHLYFCDDSVYRVACTRTWTLSCTSLEKPNETHMTLGIESVYIV